MQEAWLRFDEVSRQRLLDEPLSYLYRIVRNLALDGRRSQVREERSWRAAPIFRQKASPRTAAARSRSGQPG